MTPEQQDFEAWARANLPYLNLWKFDDRKYESDITEALFITWLARAQQSAWISVEDKLPEIDSQYLVSYKPPFATGQQTIIAFFNNGVFRLGNSCGGNISHAVTHWQPLLDPPEQGYKK